MTRFIRCAAILGGLFVASSSALAQSNGPDVIVGDIPDTCHFNFTAINGKHAYAIGTNACNVGDVPLLWHSNDNQHPVIGSNLFRLMNGRFEQIGQGWPKHGFGADNAHLCGTCPVPTDGNSLGPACSDWYDCNTNGNQQFLGPKSEINSATGGMPWPHGNGSGSGPLFKRLQANQSDLALPGALYFVEAQYIQFQDAGFGNGNNNNSYRRVTVTAPGYNLLVADATRVRRAAIQAWPDNGRGPNTPDPSVRLENVDIPGDGRVIVASKVTELGNGQWHYEYAIQNVNSDRSIGSVSVPAVGSLTLSNIEFHDVDYHSGEAYDNTDWTMARGATPHSWTSPQT